MQNASMCAGIQKRKAIQVHKRVKFKCMSEEKFKCTSESSTCTDGFSAEFTIQEYTGDRSRWARRAIFLSSWVLHFRSGEQWHLEIRGVDGSKSASRSRLEILERILQPCILSYGFTFLFALHQCIPRLSAHFVDVDEPSPTQRWPCHVFCCTTCMAAVPNGIYIAFLKVWKVACCIVVLTFTNVALILYPGSAPRSRPPAMIWWPNCMAHGLEMLRICVHHLLRCKHSNPSNPKHAVHHL